MSQANMNLLNIFFFLAVCSASWLSRRAQHRNRRHLQFVQKSLNGKTSIPKMLRVNTEDAQIVKQRRRVTSFLSLLQ